jgi:hypothetical protein
VGELREYLTFFGGWTSMLAIDCLAFGIGLALLGLLFWWLCIPKWLNRLMGAFLAGSAALVATTAAGWYIALGSVGSFSGMLCGVLWGIFAFPRLLPGVAAKSRMWPRIIASLIVCGAFLYWTVSPFIPDQDAQSLQVDVVRIVPGTEALTSGSQPIPVNERPQNQNMVGFGTSLSPDDVALLNRMGVKGRIYQGVSEGASVSGATKEARVLIVVTEPIEAPVVLREPKSVNVTYVENQSRWLMIPADAPTIRKKITLFPDKNDPQTIHISIQPTSNKAGFAFSWYPSMATR